MQIRPGHRRRNLPLLLVAIIALVPACNPATPTPAAQPAPQPPVQEMAEAPLVADAENLAGVGAQPVIDPDYVRCESLELPHEQNVALNATYMNPCLDQAECSPHQVVTDLYPEFKWNWWWDCAPDAYFFSLGGTGDPEWVRLGFVEFIDEYDYAIHGPRRSLKIADQLEPLTLYHWSVRAVISDPNIPDYKGQAYVAPWPAGDYHQWFLTGPHCEPPLTEAPTGLSPDNAVVPRTSGYFSFDWEYPQDTCVVDAFMLRVTDEDSGQDVALEWIPNNLSMHTSMALELEACHWYTWTVDARSRGQASPASRGGAFPCAATRKRG